MTMVADARHMEEKTDVKYELSPRSVNEFNQCNAIKKDDSTKSSAFDLKIDSSDKNPKNHEKGSSQYHSIQKLCAPTSSELHPCILTNCQSNEKHYQTFDSIPKNVSESKNKYDETNLEIKDDLSKNTPEKNEYNSFCTKNYQSRQEEKNKPFNSNESIQSYETFEKNLQKVHRDIESLKKQFEKFLFESYKDKKSKEQNYGILNARELYLLAGLLRKELSRNVDVYIEKVVEDFVQRHSNDSEQSFQPEVRLNPFANNMHFYAPLINEFLARSTFPQKTYFSLHNHSDPFKHTFNSYHNHFNTAFFLNRQTPLNHIGSSKSQNTTLNSHSSSEPEQTEAIPLLVSKRKRIKVMESPNNSDTSPRQPDDSSDVDCDVAKFSPSSAYPASMFPSSLATSVAVINPSITHSSFLNAIYQRKHYNSINFNSVYDKSGLSHCKKARMDSVMRDGKVKFVGNLKDESSCRSLATSSLHEKHYSEHLMTSTLTPMHLRKAKLMFFYVRYPSSSTLKAFFPDVLFNKNNTAQLIKWFSNFREFYYIQMEKYARQAISEGVLSAAHLHVTSDCELYKVLILHYNRNHKIEVPENFQLTVQTTLREFFRAIQAEKDQEQSWKKAIYKVIARLDDVIPEYFKKANWMDEMMDN